MLTIEQCLQWSKYPPIGTEWYLPDTITRWHFSKSYFYLRSEHRDGVSKAYMVKSKERRMLPIFSNNMVLQQEFLVTVWGGSSLKKTMTLTVSWNKKEYRTTSDEDGKWRFDIAGPDHKFVWADAKIEAIRLLYHRRMYSFLWQYTKAGRTIPTATCTTALVCRHHLSVLTTGKA